MKGWEMISEIKRLLKDGSNVSKVSRQLSIDRKTVRKYRDQPFDVIAENQRKAKRRKRKLDRFRSVIDNKIQLMQADGVINAQAIYDEIAKQGYAGSPRSVRRYVMARSRRKSEKERTYAPFETAPGYQAMVDLGESRKIWISGVHEVRYFIVMTLSYSRKMYVEWHDRPVDTEMFLRFHQNGFRYFEGIPMEIVYDQTKLVAISENYGEIEFNEAFHGYAQFSGFKVYLCRGNDPETKGKVESSVRYVKRGFLPGRRFESSGDLERQWWEWLTAIADKKPNETTQVPPYDRWIEERGKLCKCHESLYETKPSYKTQQVYADGCVKVLGNRYSVPRQYQGKQVKIRVTKDYVEIVNLEGEPIHRHLRSKDKGRRITVRAHFQKPPSESNDLLKSQTLRIYQNPALIYCIQHRFPRHFREQFQQLIKLSSQYDMRVLQKAGEESLKIDRVSYSAIKQIAHYISEMSFNENLDCGPIPVDFKGIQDIELGQRSSGYYDHLMGARS
jgi:transposase